MTVKPYVVSYTNIKSKNIFYFVNKLFKCASLKNSNLIIVIGGDGFMLQCLKKYYKYKKPFYGINSGDYGFLMNKFSKKNLYKNLNKAKSVSINPIEMTVRNKLGQIQKEIAINEVSILRQSKQAAKISISSNKKMLIKKLTSDGVLISTPAGSTAYNMSVHGPILNLDSKKLAITPISSFRPRRWKGKIIIDNSIIKVKNLDVNKRPISAVADNLEVRNAKIITIKTLKKIKFNLLYNINNSLNKKIKIEQLKNDI